MKASLFAAVFVVLFGIGSFAEGTGESAAAAEPKALTAPPLDSVQSNPTAQEVLEFLSPRPATPATSVGIAPASAVVSQPVPAARIRVVDAASVNRPVSSPSGPSEASVPTARIRVVNDADVSNAKTAAPEDKESEVTNADAEAAVIAATTPEVRRALDPALAKLVGTWKAVARHGDGELTTVELQLDDRGWARFTVPSSDGTPKTIERRAELNGEELKLTGPDASLLLGNLIEVTQRQMVLARAEGKLTFVRPQ